MPVGAKQTLRFGPFELDPQCGQLRKNGTGLKLQGQPIQILEILLEKPGELVTRDELRQRLWASDTFVDFDHSLNTAIKKLRQSLGDEADTPRYIETLPKRGYRFIGEVTEQEPRAEPAKLPLPPLVDGAISKAVLTLADAVVAPPPKPSDRRTWVKLAAVAALGVIAGAVIYLITRPAPMLRIIGSHALTKTGYRKARSQARLVTDGKSIYFQELRPSGVVTMQVSVNGGEALEVSRPSASLGSLRDISQDGSQLLLSVFDGKASRFDAWIQPLPVGPPRLLVKDASTSVLTHDGRGILFARNGGRELYSAKADGTDARRLAELPPFADLALSPDGKRARVAVRSTRNLWEGGSDGSGPHPILSEHKDGWSAGTWSPDGSFYYFRSWDGERYDLWGVNEKPHWWQSWWGKKPPNPVQLTFGPFTIGPPIAGKDGRQIFATASEPHGELSAWDFSRQFIPFLDGISACYVDFSHDGQWIAYVSYPEGNLWRSRIDGTERMQLTSPPLAVINPRWSPDGRQIVFMDWSGGDRQRRMGGDVSRVYVVNADGGAPLLLLAGNPAPTDPVWSPNGDAIAFAAGGMGVGSQGIRILDIATMKSVKVSGSDGLWSPRWSPDGKYLVALATGNSKLMLYTFATQSWEELASGSTSFDWPSWSRDSKQVFVSDNRVLLRITITTRKKKQIADARGFRSTAYFMYNGGWFGLTPDGRPIAMRDTATEEIYAFDLAFK